MTRTDPTYHNFYEYTVALAWDCQTKNWVGSVYMDGTHMSTATLEGKITDKREEVAQRVIRGYADGIAEAMER